MFAHFGFLGHDAAHRQIFVSGKANHRAGLVLGTLFSGMSLPGGTASTTSTTRRRTRSARTRTSSRPCCISIRPPSRRNRSRFLSFLRARQGWWFFPLLTFEGVNLHAQSFVTGFSRRSGKWQPVEMSLLTAALGRLSGLLLIVLDPGKAAAFLGVQLAVVGIYLGCTSRPNHKGMPVLPADVEVDFLRRQVLMSRNIISNRVDHVRDGRVELPDRAPPVPQHAPAEPAPGAADHQAVLHRELGDLHRDDAAAAPTASWCATSIWSGCAPGIRSTARWWRPCGPRLNAPGPDSQPPGSADDGCDQARNRQHQPAAGEQERPERDRRGQGQPADRNAQHRATAPSTKAITTASTAGETER